LPRERESEKLHEYHVKKQKLRSENELTSKKRPAKLNSNYKRMLNKQDYERERSRGWLKVVIRKKV
jgi:hypothetical protein